MLFTPGTHRNQVVYPGHASISWSWPRASLRYTLDATDSHLAYNMGVNTSACTRARIYVYQSLIPTRHDKACSNVYSNLAIAICRETADFCHHC